jgi:hypothetical protein
MKTKRRSGKEKKITVYLDQETDALIRLYAMLTGQSIAAAGEELMTIGIARDNFNRGDIDGAADILRTLQEEEQK